MELFRTNMAKTTAVGQKSAQVTTKININWLRDALGGASGRFFLLKIPKGSRDNFLVILWKIEGGPAAGRWARWEGFGESKLRLDGGSLEVKRKQTGSIHTTAWNAALTTASCLCDARWPDLKGFAPMPPAPCYLEEWWRRGEVVKCGSMAWLGA